MNAKGENAAHGKTVGLKLTSMADTVCYIKNLTKSIGIPPTTCFEITPITISKNQSRPIQSPSIECEHSAPSLKRDMTEWSNTDPYIIAKKIVCPIPTLSEDPDIDIGAIAPVQKSTTERTGMDVSQCLINQPNDKLKYTLIKNRVSPLSCPLLNPKQSGVGTMSCQRFKVFGCIAYS